MKELQENYEGKQWSRRRGAQELITSSSRQTQPHRHLCLHLCPHITFSSHAIFVSFFP